MSKTLERTTFSTSRLLEFFTAKELQMQIGHDQKWWPIALTKELIDNALDACETANVTPEIRVMVEDNAVSVQDNGPGLPVETLERSLDYAVRVSDKTHYVSPSRGQLGNALKCVWAAPFVVDGEHGRVDVVTGGKEYRIDVSLDRIVQQPNLHVAVSPNGVVKTGTFVKMHWPEIASYLRLNNRESFYNPPMSAHFLAKLYAAFNPHATFSYIGHDVDFNAEATSPDWKKWKPSDPTSPHWYDVESLQALIAAYIAEEREGGQVKTVREFVSEFKGLSGTAKQKRVIEAALFSPGDYLHDMVSGGEVSRGMVELLLEAMQGEVRPVSPATLGTIGEEHLADWLVQSFYASSDSVKYARKQGESGGLPYALEVAFAVNRSDFSGCSRDIVVGLNWAPAIKGPVFGSALPTLLSEAFVDYEDPVTVLVHLVCPKLRFTDRGKSTLELDDVITDDLGKCIRKVSKEWAAYKKRLKREARAQQREWEEAQRARQRRRYSIIDAAYEVMEGAYMKASAGGTLPANARQIMYAARPGVLRLTSGRKWKNSSYFTQMILPQYLEDFSDETADWDVVWDARGKLVEPHTAYRVDLGGIAVRRYIHNWRKCKLETSAVILDHQVETRGPEGRYSFALFVEKEGFNQLWEAVGLADKWDIAIMSTKGMSVTAARQLVDELSQKGVTILVLRDFDKAGFSIVHTLSTSGRRYQYKAKPKVIDLGLRSEDVKEMGLETEEVRYTSKKDPKQNLWASGATCAECDFLVQGGRPRHWYGERVELNAMASDQLVEWLERKLEAVGVQKVVPEPELLEKAYRRAKLIAEMQGAIDEVEKNFDTDAVEVPDDLHQKVKDMVKGTTDAWDDGIWKLAGGEVPS